MTEGVKEWTVDEQKVREYLLSRTHPVGRFKASFFASLGYGLENWQELRDFLQQVAAAGQPRKGEETEFGRKYLISGTLMGSGGRSAEVETVWIVLHGSDTARLVTVYPR